jgi:hypothetical protein
LPWISSGSGAIRPKFAIITDEFFNCIILPQKFHMTYTGQPENTIVGQPSNQILIFSFAIKGNLRVNNVSTAISYSDGITVAIGVPFFDGFSNTSLHD